MPDRIHFQGKLKNDPHRGVNLKAELEIMLLHEKLDGLRQRQWDELLQLQREQLTLLQNIGRH